jgi:AmiR/NasT family two-component response regulator
VIEQEAGVAVERLLAVTAASYERRAQLQTALESRVVIEQAKGILAERHGVELEDAFEVMRRAARSKRMKLRGLAGCVRPGCETPPEIASLLDV